MSNYRPISLLPAISKIFEKALHIQISEYFEINNLLYPSQYGFKKLHSCEYAALELIDRVIDMIDKDNTPFSLFLDLSKAFDTLDHNILLYKLKHYGFLGSALKLIENYLGERSQYILYEKTVSDLTEISIGVPQGSILGPLLFLIYINDLPVASNMFTPIMYADDTTLLANLEQFGFKSEDNYSLQINTEVEKINEWLKYNKLSLNVAKTKFMIFHLPQKTVTPPNIKINEHNIDCVINFNFLGIVIDKNLNWKGHVNHIAGKIGRANGILSSLKHFLPQKTLVNIYHALVGSHLNYGLLLWAHNNKRLHKLQKKAIRLVCNKKYNAHVDPLLKELNIPKLEHMHILKQFIFYYRLKGGKVPKFFVTFDPEMQCGTHNYATRSRNVPRPPRVKKKLSTQCLRYDLAFTIRNFFNTNIINNMNTLSELSFKKTIKMHFISNYPNSCTLIKCYVCNQL